MKHFSRRRSSVAACVSALLLLSACASQTQIREPTPSVELPQSWDLSANTGEQDWPDSGWWKRFGSDELSQLVAQGQASNLEIAAAISRVRQAEAQARIAGAPLLPNADFSTSINRALPLTSSGSGVTSTSGLLEIGYEVDFWGKNKAGLVAAEATLQANRYDRETVALTVTSGIVSTYLQVLSLRDRIEIAQKKRRQCGTRVETGGGAKPRRICFAAGPGAAALGGGRAASGDTRSETAGARSTDRTGDLAGTAAANLYRE